jgi:hypothetical protein
MFKKREKDIDIVRDMEDENGDFITHKMQEGDEEEDKEEDD